MSNGFIMVGVLSGGYSLFSVGCLTGVGVCGIINAITPELLIIKRFGGFFVTNLLLVQCSF